MKNSKTYIFIAVVVVLILAFLGLNAYQNSTAKTEIGWGGAYDTCMNASLQAEVENMGYEVTCLGENMGSSSLPKLIGDPNVERVDLLVTSSTETAQKIKDMYGPDQFTSSYSALFSSPILPLIKREDAHVLIEPGIIEQRGNYLFITNEMLNKIYQLQATRTAVWGDLGVTDPNWKDAAIILSASNPFASGTGRTAIGYAGTCLSTSNTGQIPCSRTLDYNSIDDQLKEQLRGIYVSYGSQSEDGNTINYMKQWMYDSNVVLMIMGSESFPMLFASDQGNPAYVEDMMVIYTTYAFNTAQFGHPTSPEGEKFIQDFLRNPKIAEIVNKELGSRMGYENSMLPSDAASWVPSIDPLTYIQPAASNINAPILCYIGAKEKVSAKLMWMTTFGQKANDDESAAADGRSFEEAVAAYCTENQ